MNAIAKRKDIVVLISLGVIVVVAVIVFASRFTSFNQQKVDEEAISDQIDAEADLEASEYDAPEISSKELRNLLASSDDVYMINPESRENYAKKHIPNSVSFPSEEILGNTADLPRDKTIVVTSSGSETGCTISRKVARSLVESGFPDVRDHQDGWVGWEKIGYPTVAQGETQVAQISATDLASDIENKENIFIVDLRDTAFYETSHVKSSVSIPYFDVAERLEEIPKNKKIILYDGGDGKAYLVAQSLIANNYVEVRILVGGFTEWKAKGKPIESENK